MNRSSLSKIIIFAAGALIGSAVTYKYLKERFEKLVKEEIDSVIETFSSKEEEEDKEEPDDSLETLEKYRKVLEETKYRSYTTEENEKEEEDVEKPYVISPDEFSELDDYETETLFYYADGVLTDDMDNIIDDVDDIVGVDSLNKFGEYEEDSVFVRNDITKTDYEILRDHRKYYSRPGQ